MEIDTSWLNQGNHLNSLTPKDAYERGLRYSNWIQEQISKDE